MGDNFKPDQNPSNGFASGSSLGEVNLHFGLVLGNEGGKMTSNLILSFRS